MSIINRSDDLELSVIKIFEDYFERGGDFYLISPWINNFPFTETILTKNQVNIFGDSPNLYNILKILAEAHQGSKINIITHNYGIKVGLSTMSVISNLEKIQAEIKRFDLDTSKKNFQQLYYSFSSIRREFREYSKFNDPWNVTLPRKFDDYLTFISKKENYIEEIGKIISLKNQTKTNLSYLESYKKVIDIDNINIYFHNNFHAKIFRAGSSIVTGSSNWTFSGFHKNDEINLYFSSYTSKNSFEKINERCIELEKEAKRILSDDLINNIAINSLIESIYKIFFNWLIDNKSIILSS